MKQLICILCIALLSLSSITAQTTWKTPGYQPAEVRKLMVLAKVTDMTARQQLEDFSVKFLADKGIPAIASYANLKQNRFHTREDFLAVIDSLGVDALLAYSVTGAEQVTEQKPTVSVGVGVGMYGGYVGASAPIAGGAKQVTMVDLKATFYTRAAHGEQWFATLSGKLDGPTDKLAYTVSKNTVKAMVKDGLFVTKK